MGNGQLRMHFVRPWTVLNTLILNVFRKDHETELFNAQLIDPSYFTEKLYVQQEYFGKTNSLLSALSKQKMH